MSRATPIDPVLEKGYNVRQQRGDFEQLLETWSDRSAAFRAQADGQLNLAYGSGGRDKLDLFKCGEKEAPLFVFIHGGYWKRGDKSIYSFVSAPFLESGADVALIGYELCPAIDLSGLGDKIRLALSWVWRNAKDLGVSAERINLSGHSAGGHLTALMLATRFDQLDSVLPRDLLKSGIPISGLFQLEPLRHTTISEDLGLDDQTIDANSPHFMEPATSAPLLAALGGDETSEFHRQTDEFLEVWGRFDNELARHAEPGVDHFDVVNRLADSSSALFRKTRAWLR